MDTTSSKTLSTFDLVSLNISSRERAKSSSFSKSALFHLLAIGNCFADNRYTRGVSSGALQGNGIFSSLHCRLDIFDTFRMTDWLGEGSVGGEMEGGHDTMI